MDDKGRQVHVSSMEDLANHIRLGAIDDDTELYDALDDRWAPAREHVHYVNARDDLPDDEAHQTEPQVPEPLAPVVDFTQAPGPVALGAPEVDGGATADDEAALERDWSSALKDEFLGAVPGAAGPAQPSPAMPSGGGDSSVEEPLEPSSFAHDFFDSTDEEPTPARPPKTSDMETIDGASNVFTGLDEPVLSSGSSEGPTFDDPPLPGEADSDDALMFEQFLPKPQSAPAAAAPSSAREEEAFADADGLLDDDDEDFFLIEDPSFGVEEEAPARKRRPRGRGRPNKRLLTGLVGAAVFALLMSVALPRLVEMGSELLANRETGEVDPLPGEDGDLSEQIRTEAFFLAARAQEDAFGAMDGIRRNLGVDAQPPSAWMEGVYFAHGSRYPAVESYWERYRSYMQYAQRELPTLFETSFRRHLATSAIEADSREEVAEMILQDYGERTPRMAAAFDDLTGLADAALDLHAFLVLKEDEIEYTPFTQSGVSRDPIVEAIPKTEQTREDFWNRLEQVTTRLEDLDALDRVTTSRLQEVLIERLREAGY